MHALNMQRISVFGGKWQHLSQRQRPIILFALLPKSEIPAGYPSCRYFFKRLRLIPSRNQSDDKCQNKFTTD